MAENYNVGSIKTMEFGEAANKRKGMYLSADDEESVFLGLREIISNSIDEYIQGYGKKIIITIDSKNQVFTVEDYGRGIPVGVRPDGSNSLVAALTMPHTGGKLDDEVYNSAIGTNGIGSSIVAHTSTFLQAEVYREGKHYVVKFTHSEKGAVMSSEGVVEKASKDKKRTGTTISYQPFPATYGSKKLNIEIFKDYLCELQYLTPNLIIELKIDNNPTITYHSKNGLVDALNKDLRIHQKPVLYKEIIDGVEVELALHWIKSGGEIKSYANNLYVREGGAFMTGFKTSLTKAFNNVAGTDFSGDMIRKYLDGFVSVKVKVPQFSNQAKTSLANKEARTAVATATTTAIKDFFAKNPKDLAAILKILANEKKAEDAAQRTREAINKIVTGAKTVNNLKDLPAKLADCSELGGELWLCEGE